MKDERRVRDTRDAIVELIRLSPEFTSGLYPPPEAQMIADALSWVLDDTSRPSYREGADILDRLVVASNKARLRERARRS